MERWRGGKKVKSRRKGVKLGREYKRKGEAFRKRGRGGEKGKETTEQQGGGSY